MNRFMDTTDEQHPVPVDRAINWGASLEFHIGLAGEDRRFDVDRFVDEYLGRHDYVEGYEEA